MLFWASTILLLFIGVIAADIMGFFGSKKGMEIEGKVGVHTRQGILIHH